MIQTGNIVLMGFMGTGKSAVAREISQILEVPAVDTDLLIVEREGMSIPEIFEQHGEEYFREVETAVLRSLLDRSGDSISVIALGGGSPVREVNRPLIQQLGYVVWLRTSAESTLERISGNTNRPLLQVDDPMGTILQIMQERDPIYDSVAQVRVDTENLNTSEIAAGIIDSASYYYSGRESEAPSCGQ